MKRRTPIVRPLLLAGLLAIGAGVVLGTILVWTIVLAQQWFGPERSYEYLVVQTDGTPLISTSPSAYRSESLRTLDGVEIPDREPVHTSSGLNLLAVPHDTTGMFPLPWEQRIYAFSDDRRPPTYWYFVHDGKLDGSGYFVGYDSRSKACAGYIGMDGARSEEPPVAEWIPLDGRLLATRTAFATPSYHWGGYEPYYGQGARTVQMVSGDRVLEVDFRERTVRTLLRNDQILGLVAYDRPLPMPPKPKDAKDGEELPRWRSYLAVRTPESVVLSNFAGEIQRSYPLPEELRDKWITFWEIRDGLALVDRQLDTREGNHHELSWIKATGQIERQREVLLASGATGVPAAAAWFAGATVPAPLVAAFVVPIAAGEAELGRHDERSVVKTYTSGLPAAWPALVAVALVSAALAGFCYRRQRRYAQPWTAGWMIFVFLCGVPGFLGYLLHRRWPVLHACPACGAIVPRDRDDCARCQAEFPAPAPNGTEVIAA